MTDKQTREQSLHSISESPGLRCEFLNVHIPEKEPVKDTGPKAPAVAHLLSVCDSFVLGIPCVGAHVPRRPLAPAFS